MKDRELVLEGKEVRIYRFGGDEGIGYEVSIQWAELEEQSSMHKTIKQAFNFIRLSFGKRTKGSEMPHKAKEIRTYPKDEGKQLWDELKDESTPWIKLADIQQWDAIYFLWLNEYESATYVVRLPASDSDGTMQVLARYEESSNEPWFSRGLELMALTMRIQERIETGEKNEHNLPMGISAFEHASDDQLEIPDWWTFRLHWGDGHEDKQSFLLYNDGYNWLRSIIA